MSDKDHITKRKLAVGMLLFTASFLLYSLASPGNLPGDTEIRWSVARQIVRNKGLSIEDTVQTRNFAIGVDGRRHSLWNLGQSLCLLPFAAIGLALEKFTPVDAGVADLTAQFLASTILFPAIGAMVVLVFYQLVLSLGYSKKVVIFSSAVLAFATMNFHYSVVTHEQSQVAVLLLVAILLMVKNLQKPGFLYVWLLCAALGFCLLFRLSSLVMVLPIYLVAAGAEVFAGQTIAKPKIVGKWLAAGFLGVGGFVAVIGWYNYVRFGSVFEGGHRLATITTMAGHELFESSPLPTLAAMLFSPGKSIILYNPVLLLLPVCIYGFYRRHKVVALAITAAIVANFVFNSFYTTWAGDYAWSVRFQAPVLPFLILPLVVLFNRPLKALAKTVVMSVIVVSIVIQLASVVYNFNLEFVQNPNHHLIPGDYVWNWSQSHLRKRFENIIRHAADKRDFSSVKVIDEEPMLLKHNQSEQSVRLAYCVNFFPFKVKGMLPSTKLFYPLLCIWLVLLIVFCVVVFKLVQFYIGQRQKTVPCR
jgi:hypothetical protein